MKILVIRGNVLGGHFIADMGLQVPYEKEVRVPYDRAAWSRDMTSAIEKGMVTRVSITQTVSPPRQPPTGQNRRAPVPGSAPPRAPAPSVEGGKESVQALQEMNTKLMERLDDLTSAQTEMMKELTGILGALPTSLAALSQTSSPASTREGGPEHRKRSPQEQGPEEDSVIFIPSKIRSDDLKIPEGSSQAVEESQKESASLNDASAALSAMRKKTKKSKKTK